MPQVAQQYDYSQSNAVGVVTPTMIPDFPEYGLSLLFRLTQGQAVIKVFGDAIEVAELTFPRTGMYAGEMQEQFNVVGDYSTWTWEIMSISGGGTVHCAANTLDRESTVKAGDFRKHKAGAGAGGAFDVASLAETQALTNNTKGITPLRGAQQAEHLFGRSVANEAAMLALTDVVPGSEVRRTDLGVWMKLKALPASTLSNWEAAESAGSFTLNGGPDYKLVTETVTVDGARIATYTDDTGIVWTRNYNDAGDGSLTSETALGGLLVRTWSYTPNGLGYISAGAVKKSGKAWRVNAADMANIKTQLTALGAAVDAPLFYVQDLDLTIEWNRLLAAFRGESGVEIVWDSKVNLASIVAPGAAENTAYTAPVFPAWLRGPRGKWRGEIWMNYPGEVGNKTTRWKVNGSGFITMIGGTATVNAVNHVGELWTFDADNFQAFSGSATAANAFGQTNISPIPALTNVVAGTDLTFTATAQYSDAGDGANTITIPIARLTYQHP